VRQTAQAEILHFVAAAYGQRPSTILGITDEWAAYNLDAAVLVIGRRAEARALEKGSGPRKPSGNGSKRISWGALKRRFRQR
jgi:hypothetical protein